MDGPSAETFVIPLWQWGLVPLAAGAVGYAVWRGKLGGAALAAGPERVTGLRALDAAVGLLLLVAAMVFAGALLAALFPGEGMLEGSGARVGAKVVLMQLATFGPVACYTLARAAAGPADGDDGLRGLGVWPPRPLRDVGSAVVPAVVGLLVTLGLLTLGTAAGVWLGAPPPSAVQHDLLFVFQRAQGPAAWALLLLGTVVVAPVFEELVFRGLLQTATLSLVGRSRRWLAIVPAAVLFALVHYSVASPHATPALLGFGLLLGWLYERTGRLWPCVLVHAAFNGFNVAVVAASAWAASAAGG